MAPPGFQWFTRTTNFQWTVAPLLPIYKRKLHRFSLEAAFFLFCCLNFLQKNFKSTSQMLAAAYIQAHDSVVCISNARTCPQVSVEAVRSWIVYMSCNCLRTAELGNWVLPRGFHVHPCHPSDTSQPLCSCHDQSCPPKNRPCPGGRGPITRLITQAWLLKSEVVPGHLSLLLSEDREEVCIWKRKRGKDTEIEREK